MKSGKPTYSELSTDKLVELLCTYGAGVPLELAQEIVARGAEAVPALCEIVADEAWWDAPDNAAAVHAMHLLGAIGDPRAAAALLAPLARNEPSDFMTENMPGVLAHLGPQVIPDLVWFMEDAGQDEIMRSVVYDALVGISLLHPGLREQVQLIGRELVSRCLSTGEFLPPLIAERLAEFQDPADLALLEHIREAGLWCEEDIPWREILEAFREGLNDWEKGQVTRDPMDYFAPAEQARLAKVWEEWRRS